MGAGGLSALVAEKKLVAKDGPRGAYYQSHRTPCGCKVYEQFETVAAKPNPPSGPRSARNNRPEGYADYRVGRFYVACESVAVTLETDAPGDEPRRWPTASSAGASVPERAARTEFRLLATCDDPALSLATATLAEGGRTHQIRRHLQMGGTPIVADKFYGTKQTNRRFKGVYGSLL